MSDKETVFSLRQLCEINAVQAVRVFGGKLVDYPRPVCMVRTWRPAGPDEVPDAVMVLSGQPLKENPPRLVR